MQKALLFLLVTSFYSIQTLHAQDEVLFSVGDTKVNKSEFEYIYQKNNFNNKADYSKQSLQDYLNLYINFRLKVKEALHQGLDTNDRFKEELTSYEKQLIDSYVEKDIMDKLVAKEYERSQKDVNISHIFFATTGAENEADALAKALEAAKKIKSGVSFEEVAKSSSEDKQTASNGGKVGWFNSYQMSYPEIEEATYNMKVGEVSEPIKTRSGYHILKLNETRPARPKIKIAIVKRFFPITDTSAAAKKMAEDTINLAYAKLKSKVPFEDVVQKYSDDEFSKGNKGQLDWFGINTYAKIVEETAYALKDGEFSAPIKTTTAWYIIKRLETAKPLTFEESIPILKVKLINLPQYQFEVDKFVNLIAEKYNVKEFKNNYSLFKDRLINFAQTAPFTYKDTTNANILLQVGNKKYDENDFGKKIQEIFYTIYPKQGENKYDAVFKNAMQSFVIDYYKNDIRLNNEEFKRLLEEYKNGIMIFSLSENNIWNKASEDTVGLLAFYNQHPTDFNLKNRATVRTIKTDNLKQATAIYKDLQANKHISDENLLSKMKVLSVAAQNLTSQVLDATKTKLNVTTESLSPPKLNAGKYEITQVLNPLPEKARAFNECRGYVVAAYQEYLEKKWIDELKQKYPVSINQSAFDHLVKK